MCAAFLSALASPKKQSFCSKNVLCVCLCACVIRVCFAVGVSVVSVNHFQSFTRACTICISLGIREGCRGDSNEQQDTGSCHDNWEYMTIHVLVSLTTGVYRPSYGVTTVWYRPDHS